MAGCHGFDMLLEPGVIGRGFKDLSRGNRWSVHVECASKPAMRVMREVEKAGRNVTSVLRRKSRGLSRAAQLEVLDEFVQRERPELVLPMYKMVRDAVWYKWDARLHARIVALLAKDGQSNAAMLQDLPEVQEFLSLPQRADLGCALIESYAHCGLQSHALAAFQDLQSLPLARAVPFGYKSLIRAYCVLDLPSEAEQFLRAMQVAGYQPSGDEYKSLIHGFGRNGMLREMEMLACEMCNQGVALDTAGFNMIISSYGQAGQHDKMVEVVDRMIAAGVEPNLVSWNALTKACPSLITALSDGCGLLASPELLLLRLKEQRASSPGEICVVKVLLLHGVPPKAVTWSSASWQLDLHSMSLGTACVIFPMWLSCLRDQFKSGKQAPGEVRVVTGWGKHSEADVRAPIRRMMVAGLGAMESPFKADPNNCGTLVARGSALKQWLLTLPSN